MITSLRLRNYRNLTHFQVETHNKIIFLSGPNGAGKTSVLEAISLLGLGGGMRKAALSDVIKREEPSAYIEAIAHINYENTGVLSSSIEEDQDKLHSSLSQDYQFGESELNLADKAGAELGDAVELVDTVELSMEIQREPIAKKILTINGSKSKVNELSKIVSFLALTPQMSGFFLGPSSERRNWLDRVVYAHYPAHVEQMKEHNFYLQKRLELLKMGYKSGAQIDFYENKIAFLSRKILMRRQLIIQDLNSKLQLLKEFDLISGQTWLEGEILTCSEEEILKTLFHKRQIDASLEQTTFSIHKTDLKMNKEKNDMRNASTGEQRLGLIGLSLCSANRGILLLLDELLCHLDSRHRSLVMKYISTINAQVWISGNDFSDLMPNQDISLIAL